MKIFKNLRKILTEQREENWGKVRQIETESDFQNLITASRDKPVFLLKHSTRCFSSGKIWQLFKEFAEKEDGAEYRMILVIQNRNLSDQIVYKTNIHHESPQVLLFYKGEVTWHAEHWLINQNSLISAFQNIKINAA